MKISGIYKIQSKSHSNRCYIGSAIHLNNRWSMHLYQLKRNKHHSIKLQRHFNKYGEDDLLFSIITTCDKEELDRQEQFFIDSYKPYFNICQLVGRPTGIKRSDEFKEKIRQSRLGKKMSEEQKKKIGDALRGEKNILYGKHQSEETKRKIGLANKGRGHGFKKGHKINNGRKHSEEWNLNYSKANKGRISPLRGVKLDPQIIDKMKEAKKGNKYCVGRVLSDSTKNKISQALREHNNLKRSA